MKKKRKKFKKKKKLKKNRPKKTSRKLKIRRIKRFKRSKKRRVQKRRVKTRAKRTFSIPKIQLKNKKISLFKKITFQHVVNFILQPVFVAYENFIEKRRFQKLKKIALEKQEKERRIKEERRLL